MNWLGHRAEDSTIEVWITTHAAAGGVVAPGSAFENSDVAIYKDGSATQKTAVDGLTITSPFDSETGLHLLSIDTSNDTNDVGFWAAGSRYMVYLAPDETVDGQTVGAVVAEFILGPAPVNATHISGDSTAADNAELFFDGTGYGAILQRTTIATLASQTSFTLTAGSTDDNAYNDCTIVIQDASTAAQKAIGIVKDYTGASLTVTLLADPGIFTMATTDIVTILAPDFLTRYIAAICHGLVTGAGTGTEVFKGIDGSTTRATVTVDSSGNRSGVTYG